METGLRIEAVKEVVTKDRPDNWVILHPTDAVRFRADYANPVYVKDASVREIDPLA